MSVPNNANTYLPATPVTPLYFLITNITQAYPMVVTGQVPNLYILPSTPNTYQVGQRIVLTVPPAYGMIQANELQANIIDINGLNFSLNVDSTYFDAFVTPSGTVSRPASFAPAGSMNYQYSNSSTFVPFQSASTFGN